MLIQCPKCGAMRSNRSKHCSTCEAKPIDRFKASGLVGYLRPDQINFNSYDKDSLYFSTSVHFDFRGQSPVHAFIETMTNGCCGD